MTETVSDWERAREAINAIAELRAAERWYASGGWTDEETAWKRLLRAREAREKYSEYDDNFRGH